MKLGELNITDVLLGNTGLEAVRLGEDTLIWRKDLAAGVTFKITFIDGCTGGTINIEEYAEHLTVYYYSTEETVELTGTDVKAVDLRDCTEIGIGVRSSFRFHSGDLDKIKEIHFYNKGGLSKFQNTFVGLVNMDKIYIGTFMNSLSSWQNAFKDCTSLTCMRGTYDTTASSNNTDMFLNVPPGDGVYMPDQTQMDSLSSTEGDTWINSNGCPAPTPETYYRIFFRGLSGSENKILSYYDTKDDTIKDVPTPDPGNFYIFDFVVSKYNNVIYLNESSTYDIYKSTDFGNNWELVTNNSYIQSISPDGSSIAYGNYNTDNILYVNINGTVYTAPYLADDGAIRLLNGNKMLLSSSDSRKNLFEIYDVVNDTVLYHLDGNFRGVPGTNEDLSKIYVEKYSGSVKFLIITDPLGTNQISERNTSDVFYEDGSYSFDCDTTGEKVIGIRSDLFEYSNDYGVVFNLLYYYDAWNYGNISSDGKLLVYGNGSYIRYSFDEGTNFTSVSVGYDISTSSYIIQQYTE